jgi:hypothetical protein
MSRGLWAWSLVACAHVSLAVCGAMRVAPAEGTPVGDLIAEYGFASGADASFAFFAPAVSSLSRVSLTLRDAQGHEWADMVFGEDGSVYGLRSSAVFDLLEGLSERMLRGLTASWAGMALGRHPAATEARVVIEVEALPTMREWRAGQRPTWLRLYEATFRRNDAAAGPPAPR